MEPLESPRGWGSDDEEQDDFLSRTVECESPSDTSKPIICSNPATNKIQVKRSEPKLKNDSEESVPLNILKKTESKSSCPPDKTKAPSRVYEDEEENVEMLKKRICRLNWDLSEARQHEDVLTQELRRMRVEYDKGVVRHSRHILASNQSALSNPQSELHQGENFDDWSKDLEEKEERDNAIYTQSKISCDNSCTSEDTVLIGNLENEALRLRQLLNRSWEEAQQKRAESKQEISELENKNYNLTSQLNEVMAERNEVRQEVAKTHKKLSMLRSTVEHQKEEIARMANAMSEKVAEARAECDIETNKLVSQNTRLREENARYRRQIEQIVQEKEKTNVKAKQDLSRQEKDMHEQFIAYRKLRKKNTEDLESFAHFYISMKHILTDTLERAEREYASENQDSSGKVHTTEEENGENKDNEENSSPKCTAGNSRDQQTILRAVAKLKATKETEEKLRQLAERNYGICQKRLDRAIVKIQRMTDELNELQSVQKEISGMSVSEYERWWSTMTKGTKKSRQSLHLVSSKQQKYLMRSVSSSKGLSHESNSLDPLPPEMSRKNILSSHNKPQDTHVTKRYHWSRMQKSQDRALPVIP
uniref:Uncharacterized protein n=1 Tax=Mucochytrium quahogii TaxID=96639 RepID=A0A7S2SPT6_9STRA|mmetsp:Transcript_9795/g.21304  ORF Transcript_9795/g.21304 Transcript_9795/m.21304 type:complete len:592 (+) Transcript_9795:52-1827(+)